MEGAGILERPSEGRPARAEIEIKRREPRCPYCHEEVSTSEREQLACNRCRAWHHQACWTEAGARCSSCGSDATGLFLPSSSRLALGAARIEAPQSEGSQQSGLLGSLLGLPAWLRVLAYALLVVALLVTYATHLVVRPEEGFSWGVLVSTLFAAGSVWAGTAAAWVRWPDPNDPGLLGLSGSTTQRDPAARAQLAQRFEQSTERFNVSGVSLVNPAGLDVLDALIVCGEQIESPQALLALLVPLSRDRLAPPLVVVAPEVGDEVLDMFRVNAERGALAGFVVRTTPAQTREIARTCGATLLRTGRAARCRDVARERVRIDASGVEFLTPAGVVRVPYTPPSPLRSP